MYALEFRGLARITHDRESLRLDGHWMSLVQDSAKTNTNTNTAPANIESE